MFFFVKPVLFYLLTCPVVWFKCDLNARFETCQMIFEEFFFEMYLFLYVIYIIVDSIF